MTVRLFLTMCQLAGAWQGGNAQTFREQFIFDLQPQHVHGSSIIACPNGDLLACWFQGSGERTADDVVINGARLRAGEKRWSPVFLMADSPQHPDCNPVLFINQREQLFLFWIMVQGHRWEASLLKYRISEDYLRPGPPVWTWQDVIALNIGDAFGRTIAEGFRKNKRPEGAWAEYAPQYDDMILKAAQDPVKRIIGWMTRIHPLMLPQGRLLLPLYSDGYNLSLIAISEDQGQTWRASLPIAGRGNVQPSLVQQRDGTIVAYMRDNGDHPGLIMQSRSTDAGESWSPAIDTELPNPGASVEALVLRSGRWVIVYNDAEEGRHSLAIALSDDEGRTWKWRRRLAYSADHSEAYAYPSLIQTRDGRLHLTYSFHRDKEKSIRYVTFDEKWILQTAAR